MGMSGDVSASGMKTCPLMPVGITQRANPILMQNRIFFISKYDILYLLHHYYTI